MYSSASMVSTLISGLLLKVRSAKLDVYSSLISLLPAIAIFTLFIQSADLQMENPLRFKDFRGAKLRKSKCHQIRIRRSNCFGIIRKQRKSHIDPQCYLQNILKLSYKSIISPRITFCSPTVQIYLIIYKFNTVFQHKTKNHHTSFHNMAIVERSFLLSYLFVPHNRSKLKLTSAQALLHILRQSTKLTINRYYWLPVSNDSRKEIKTQERGVSYPFRSVGRVQ